MTIGLGIPDLLRLVAVDLTGVTNGGLLLEVALINGGLLLEVVLSLLLEVAVSLLLAVNGFIKGFLGVVSSCAFCGPKVDGFGGNVWPLLAATILFLLLALVLAEAEETVIGVLLLPMPAILVDLIALGLLLPIVVVVVLGLS